MAKREGKKVESNFNDIGGLILKTLIRQGLYELAAIHAFNCCVPESLKGKCEAEKLEGNTLFVKVTHGAIAQELFMQKRLVLDKINENLTNLQVRDIRII